MAILYNSKTGNYWRTHESGDHAIVYTIYRGRRLEGLMRKNILCSRFLFRPLFPTVNQELFNHIASLGVDYIVNVVLLSII